MKRSANSWRCLNCGDCMRSRQTWKKGSVRKRQYICPSCGESFTTSETRDREEKHENRRNF